MLVDGVRRVILNAALTLPRGFSDPKNPTASLSDIIVNYTPLAFRLAVKRTGRFLYRGENSLERFKILAPEPDLLVPGTYDDTAALVYFQCLERRLSTRETDAIPSIGHIATSDRAEASHWGDAVSIWPLGTSFSFIWPVRSKLLFPPATLCPNDDLAINHDLEMALKLGHEVLFASAFYDPKNVLPGCIGDLPESAFLAVPSSYDNELKDLMKQTKFAT